MRRAKFAVSVNNAQPRSVQFDRSRAFVPERVWRQHFGNDLPRRRHRTLRAFWHKGRVGARVRRSPGGGLGSVRRRERAAVLGGSALLQLRAYGRGDLAQHPGPDVRRLRDPRRQRRLARRYARHPRRVREDRAAHEGAEPAPTAACRLPATPAFAPRAAATSRCSMPTICSTRRTLPAHAANLADKSVGVSYARVRMITFEGRPTGEETRPKLEGLTAADLLRTNQCTALVVIRRDVFAAVGLFNESLRRVEDQEFLFRVTAAGWRLRGIDAVLVELSHQPRQPVVQHRGDAGELHATAGPCRGDRARHRGASRPAGARCHVPLSRPPQHGARDGRGRSAPLDDRGAADWRRTSSCASRARRSRPCSPCWCRARDAPSSAGGCGCRGGAHDGPARQRRHSALSDRALYRSDDQLGAGADAGRLRDRGDRRRLARPRARYRARLRRSAHSRHQPGEPWPRRCAQLRHPACGR